MYLSTRVHVLDVQQASVHRTSASSLICLGYKIPVSNVTGSEDGKNKQKRKELMTGMMPGEPSIPEQYRSVRVLPFFVSSSV